ncbi:MAG TPA: glucose-6-phosphate isomerase [Abditibacteriaceae bacterium]|nr:glucose-6-phosphate isomerase [Abditibacteriaceae bacterium]
MNATETNATELWRRYKEYALHHAEMGFSLDISRMDFSVGFFKEMEPRLQRAYQAMAELESGAIANPDEGRRVGHYWLRAPQLAPDELGAVIKSTWKKIKAFAAQVHEGAIVPERGGVFKNLLLIGIGGSALGPQFVTHALCEPGQDKMQVYFFDNTDPDGMDRILARIGDGLAQTLTIVISKSGGTKETRNGMLEAHAAYHEAGLHFGRHAVAITEKGSALDKVANDERWLERFPMWDWVGGRTSETSAVGLLPAALQGYDINAILRGAAAMDEATRTRDTRQNPAALLAAMWFHATGGVGKKDMVILPYKDRLELFPRYLQQLVMESLGKEKDLDGKIVHQGIAVYGNKGSTDQHAYVQQLREGVLNFFVTFIEVLTDRQGSRLEVEPGVSIGDYLSGFLHGTRRALYENGRASMTITVREVNAETVGQLIALYERAVGFYGSLVNVNAYHQPGVEAGKQAAQEVIALQGRVLEALRAQPGAALTADEIAHYLGAPANAEDVYHLLRHLAANNRVARQSGAGPGAAYQIK